MRRALFFLVLFSCSSPATGGRPPVDAGASEDAPTLPQDGQADAEPPDAGQDVADALGPDAARDGGVPEGSTDAGQDAQDVDACRQQACAQYKPAPYCGQITGFECGGQPVICPCPYAADLCGDNGVVGMCGHHCLDQGWESYCNDGSRWGVYPDCVQPYRVDAGAFELREGGTSGCNLRPMGVGQVLCCP